MPLVIYLCIISKIAICYPISFKWIFTSIIGFRIPITEMLCILKIVTILYIYTNFFNWVSSTPSTINRIIVTIMAVEGSLSLTVVDEAEGVVVIFGGKYAPETARAGKTEGVVGGEGVVRDSGGRDRTRDGAKGSVVVVGCDAIALFKVHHLRHILIAVKGVEEFVATWICEHKEWARSDRFG